MPLTTESPRFSLRAADFADVARAIDTVGHAVLDDVWNPHYLSALHERAKTAFETDDDRFMGKFDEFPPTLIEQYLGGHSNLDSLSLAAGLDPVSCDSEFFLEMERTGLPALLRHFHGCDVVVGRSERVVRRADPRFRVRFTGLHHDGQLGPCSRNGIASKREFTIWTPLQPCIDEDTPRLLLIHRDDGVPVPEIEADPEVGHPILLKLKQVRNEDEYLHSVGSFDEMFEHVYRNARCYAPHIPIGSAILFEHVVYHSTYLTSAMKTPRYSLDVRSVGEYRRAKENRTYDGVIYRSGAFPVVRPIDRLRSNVNWATLILKNKVRKIVSSNGPTRG
jgi:hypothetical protein